METTVDSKVSENEFSTASVAKTSSWWDDGVRYNSFIVLGYNNYNNRGGNFNPNFNGYRPNYRRGGYNNYRDQQQQNPAPASTEQ